MLNFSGVENVAFFEPKCWWKYIYCLLKSSCFELFGNGKYGVFLIQKVDGKMIFTGYWKVLVLGYWKVLVLNFSVMGNTVFFLTKKVDVKLIFTWSFWAFYDIPRPGKHGFFLFGDWFHAKTEIKPNQSILFLFLDEHPYIQGFSRPFGSVIF